MLADGTARRAVAVVLLVLSACLSDAVFARACTIVPGPALLVAGPPCVPYCSYGRHLSGDRGSGCAYRYYRSADSPLCYPRRHSLLSAAFRLLPRGLRRLLCSFWGVVSADTACTRFGLVVSTESAEHSNNTGTKRTKLQLIFFNEQTFSKHA